MKLIHYNSFECLIFRGSTRVGSRGSRKPVNFLERLSKIRPLRKNIPYIFDNSIGVQKLGNRPEGTGGARGSRAPTVFEERRSKSILNFASFCILKVSCTP